MTEPIITRGFIKTIVNADLRDGICTKCNVRMEVKKVWIDTKRTVDDEVIVTPKLVNRAVCPKCGGFGGEVGHLIVRPTSIQAPAPPSCISFKCLWKFINDSLFVDFLSTYHRRRVAYAVANKPEKGKVIPEKYRTGTPAPETIVQAIREIIKLKLRR